MKRLLLALSLLAVMGCSGKNYSMTEGPFRGKFARPFSIQMVNQPWSMPIFLNGRLPDTPVHVEGYLDNNGTEYYQHHSDLPELRTRSFTVQNKFTVSAYCEAVGRPLDRFSADKEFWNRRESPGDPHFGQAPISPDVATGFVDVRFRFHEFKQNSHDDWVPGKLLLEVKTRVKLECPMCDCGGQLR